MRKKGMGKAAAVIAAAMLFSLFSEAGNCCTADGTGCNVSENDKE